MIFIEMLLRLIGLKSSTEWASLVFGRRMISVSLRSKFSIIAAFGGNFQRKSIDRDDSHHCHEVRCSLSMAKLLKPFWVKGSAKDFLHVLIADIFAINMTPQMR